MTPHIEAKKEDIAKTVIMPGDPLRAKFIAENYLDDYKLVNKVRGMYAYTGFYKGKRVTVMASGMGIASIGIYSYELFKFYDVDNIIRIGSCGSYTDKINVYDIILVKESYSLSTYALSQNGYAKNIIEADLSLNNHIKDIALKNNINLIEGRIHCSDVFYSDVKDVYDLYNNQKCLGVEMESFGLFHNAKSLNKKASCILTVTDNVVTKEEIDAKKRETTLIDMIKLALESL